MKISTFLISSAAMLAVSASNASAADAIMADEPDPVEYVRVCDAFGSGYFYIPGTETCLKLSGVVRMRVTAASTNGKNPESYGTSYRGRLNIDTKSDTELGDLHARLRLQGDSDGPNSDGPSKDANVEIDQAYLQLGGLLAGYSESAWVYSTNGGDSGFGGKGIYDGSYGYQQRNMLQYQFEAGSLFAAISLEDDNDDTSWVPDVVGRLGGKFGEITVFGVVGYDQSAEEFGVKLGLNTDIGEAGNFILQGFYASGTTSYNAKVDKKTPTWSVLAAYDHKLTETITAFTTGQYFADIYNAQSVGTGVNAWAVSGGLKWAPVTNFHVTLNGEYSDTNTSVDSDNDWKFVTEISRSF